MRENGEPRSPDLSDGDFLDWYNSEITRYRDYEWAVSGYAGALSIALTVKADGGSSYIPQNELGTSILVLLLASFLLWSETHIHWRLSHFRARRTALLSSQAHMEVDSKLVARNKDGSLNGTDFAYLLGFQLFIAGTALYAVFFVGNKYYFLVSLLILSSVWVWAIKSKHRSEC